MRVIPVIDLMRGIVVRGVGGRRDEYQAIRGILAADALAATVGAAFSKAGFSQAYLADLDAIAGGEPAWQVYSDVIGCGLGLWVDAGLSHREQARRLMEFSASGRQIAGIVAGLESIGGPRALGEMCQLVGPDRLIFSLDLKSGTPLTPSPDWTGLSAMQIATLAVRVGVRRMIVLDLAAVGMGQGVATGPLCRQLRALAPKLEIVGGGGVRDWQDLHVLAASGCDAALVASALHDGRLAAAECAALR